MALSYSARRKKSRAKRKKTKLMYAEERQREILERVRREGKVSVEALTEALGVSAPTIRADLGTLETRRLLRRTHGGAILPETTLYEPPYAERERARQSEKARIGAAAAARVRDHETVLLDAGTTTFEIAVRLKERVGLTVVTNSLEAAWELMDAPPGHIETLVVGGAVHASRRATLGPLAAEFLSRLHVDRAFLGVNGVFRRSGLHGRGLRCCPGQTRHDCLRPRGHRGCRQQQTRCHGLRVGLPALSRSSADYRFSRRRVSGRRATDCGSRSGGRVVIRL